MAEKSSWDQANRRQRLGLVWRNRKKISQIIKDYFYLPFFLLLILCLQPSNPSKLVSEARNPTSLSAAPCSVATSLTELSVLVAGGLLAPPSRLNTFSAAPSVMRPGCGSPPLIGLNKTRKLKGHGNKQDFPRFLHKSVRHRYLTLHFDPFQFWLRILGDIRIRKRLPDSTVRGVGDSTYH
jgi:hypothetical protein